MSGGAVSDFPRGMSFDAAYELEVTVSDLPVPDLTGWTGAAKLKPVDTAPIDLTFAWINAAARIAGVTFGSTAAWPLGGARLEMQLTSPLGAKIDVPPVLLRITKGFDDV